MSNKIKNDHTLEKFNLRVKFYKRKIKLFFRNIRLMLFKKIYDRGNGQIQFGDNFLVEKNIKKIVVITFSERIGDLLVKTALFREIKKVHPDIYMSIVVKDGSARDIVEYNPNIDKKYRLKKDEMNKLSKEINSEKYDLLILLTGIIKEKEIKFIKDCGARYNFGLNKTGWNLFNLTFEEGIDIKKDSHMTKITEMMLDKLGIKNSNGMYDLYLNKERNDIITKLLSQKEKEKQKIVVFNPYSAKVYRSFNEESIKKIINLLHDYKVIVLYYGNKYYDIKKISEKYKNVYVPENIKTILDSVIYIKLADLIITPDTGVVHIASIFDKKMIVAFADTKKGDSGILAHKIWAPISRKYAKLFVDTTKEKYDYNHENIDINDIDFNELDSIVKSFMS